VPVLAGEHLSGNPWSEVFDGPAAAAAGPSLETRRSRCARPVVR
jgi:hypothetical protein